MTKKEFRPVNEYRYNRSGPVRWIVSHVMRYPFFPLATILAAILNNWAYSYRQVLIGRAFDLISSAGWQTRALLAVALTLVGWAVVQGVTGLARNFAVEFSAQRIERDARDELYASLLGKSQTFHGRQRIGDIMARATEDVRMLNFMFSPGLMLITDSAMALLVPLILIAQLDWRLLLVPLIFTGLLALTVADYNRRLKSVSIALRDQFGTMNAGLAEAIAGIEVVKANAQEPREWADALGLTAGVSPAAGRTNSRTKENEMDRMIAYCGLICTDCPAYIATQADDRAALERVAAQWRQEYNAPDITVESVICDGCLTDQGRKGSHCFECDIRACAMALNAANCAHCADYACEKLQGFFGFVPDARATLDGIRAGLAG